MVNGTINENGNENGSENGSQNANVPARFMVGGRFYDTYKEAVEAQDRRLEALLQCGGVEAEKDLALRVVPDDATPQTYNSEPDWPIAAAVDQVFAERFPLFTGSALNAVTHETRYLIPGILAAGQTSAMLGPFKTLKTSLALDLAIALASGTPFLGRFPVTETGRVLFLAGDAGLPALQAKARRICAARGLSLAALDNLMISPQVPRLDSQFDLMALEELLLVQKPLLLVIDPADIALGNKSRGKSAPTDVRQLLGELTQLAESVGCTVLIVQHAKPPRKAGDPATLDELAGNGLAESAAQWLLVSRRRPFAVGGGRHELWLTTGNRIGDQGLWEIDVDETPATGEAAATGANARRWQTTVREVTSFDLRADEQWVAANSDRHLRRRALTFERQCQRTLEMLTAFPDGCTSRNLRDTLGMSGDRITRVLDGLIERGVVVKTVDTIIDRRRPMITYSRVQAVDLSAEALRSRPVKPDPKVYEKTTGQFVERPTPSRCPNFAEIRRALAARAASPTVEPATTNESQPTPDPTPEPASGTEQAS
jgi:AAA domain